MSTPPLRTVAALAAVVLVASAAASAAPPVSAADLLESMLDPVRWAEAPRDGAEPRVLGGTVKGAGEGEGAGVVVADLAGPGVVARLWFDEPRGAVRIAIDEQDVFEGPLETLVGRAGAVGSPLADGRTCLLPMPFAQRCVISLHGAEGLRYRIDATRFAAATPVEPMTKTWLDENRALLDSINERMAAPAAEFIYRSRLPRSLPPGSTLLFQMASAGALAELRLRLGAPDVESALRACVLVGRFDGVETIRCPLGDFFGAAPGLPPYGSVPTSIEPDGTLVSRWLMPFARDGALTIENTSDETFDLAGTIGSTDYAWDEARSLHFHARWAQIAHPASSFEIASITGRGRWVGEAVHVANPVATWWGAGPTRWRIDGAEPLVGVGADGDFGFDPEDGGAPHGAFHGRARVDGPGQFGHNSVQRFRAIDALPFTESLSLEIGVRDRDPSPSWSATVWFYGRDIAPAAPSFGRAERAVRRLELPVWRRPGAVEGEDLEIAERTEACLPLPEVRGDGTAGSWSGMTHMLCKAFAPGQSMTFSVPVETAGRHEILVYLPTCVDYGAVQCAVNGEAAGAPIDLHADTQPEQPWPPQEHSLGVFELAPPSMTITIANAGGDGVEWAVDCVVVRRVE